MFQTLLVAPLYNTFIFLVDLTGGNVGLAIIILTLCIRILFYGAFSASIRTQMGMQAVQGELAEINRVYKDNPEEKAARTMRLFKEKKIKPFGGLIALLIQIPIFLALYFAFFREGLPNIATQLLYPAVHAPAQVGILFLGINLLTSHNILLALLVGATQYAAIRLSLLRTNPSVSLSPEQAAAQRVQKTMMLYGMPIVLTVFAYTFPAGVGLYFITGNIISVFQEWLIRRSL